MTADLILAAEAELDVSEAYDWYENRRHGLGEDFLTCIDACIQQICRAPENSRKSVSRLSTGTAETISLCDFL